MKALIYFLHNPWPAKTGLHRRCFQIIAMLREAGYEVTFASSTLHTEQPWTRESIDAIARITERAPQVFHPPGRIASLADRLERKYRRNVSGQTGFPDWVFCPYSLIHWFRRLVDKLDPQIVLINYMWFDPLMNHSRWSDRCRVIETIDLQSINRQMWEFAEAQLVSMSELSDGSCLRDEFNSARKGFQIDARETELYRKYDKVICISEIEKEALAPFLSEEQTYYLPFVEEPLELGNSYDGAPIVSLGPNPFNRQGYLYFMDAVLPRIVKAVPDFRLIVTGSMSSPPRTSPHIDWQGFVRDRSSLFRTASYSISPVFSGTGQQIKIIEAMARGLAVVVFEEAAKSSFLRHNENSLIAHSAEEFAEHVIWLEQDRDLRIRLGRGARSTIADEYQRFKCCPALFPSAL